MHEINSNFALACSIVGTVAFAASFLSCSAVVVYFVGFSSREMRLSSSARAFRRLVLYLSLADVVASLAWIGGEWAKTSSHVVCDVLGPILQWAQLSSCLWTAAIATEVLYGAVRTRVSEATLELQTPASRFLWPLYHGVCWGVPLLWIIDPIIQHRFGAGLLSCWYDAGDPFNLAFMAAWIAIGVYMFVVYLVAVPMYQRKLQLSGFYTLTEIRASKAILYRSALFIVVYWVCWGTAVPLASYRQFEFDPPKWLLYTFILLASIGVPSVGWLNAMAYGFQPLFAKWLQKVLR